MVDRLDAVVRVMPLAPVNHEPTVKPRRTVRIIEKRRIPREAVISLSLAGVVALTILAFWWFSATSEEAARPHTRTLEETELLWRCENGHTFSAAGQTGARLCLFCEKLAYPVTRFSCPVHGPFQVTVQFGDGADEASPIVKLRLTGRDWVNTEVGLRCPRCDRLLEYRPTDPLRGAEQPPMP